MSKLRKFYVRETRDQLGRYPNWPINQEIGLGQVGDYSGREADFRWHTSLNDLGVNVAAVPAKSLYDELYTTEDAVSLDFTADAGHATRANLRFSRKKSIATQGYQLGHSRLELRDLLVKLSSAIETKKVTWQTEWLVITELWSCQAFTTLISGQSNGQMSISASSPATGMAFNIANPTLGLGVSSSSGMAYQGVAEQGKSAKIHPFFHAHRLIKHDTRGWMLKRYGDHNGWFWSN